MPFAHVGFGGFDPAAVYESLVIGVSLAIVAVGAAAFGSLSLACSFAKPPLAILTVFFGSVGVGCLGGYLTLWWLFDVNPDAWPVTVMAIGGGSVGTWAVARAVLPELPRE
jgi:hypothetical protein